MIEADSAKILTRLIADAGNEGDELDEAAAVQFQLADFFACDDAGEIGGLRLHLSDADALDDDLFADLAQLQSHIHALLFRHLQDDAPRGEGLEAFRGDGQFIRAGGESTGEIVTVTVSGYRTSEADGGTTDLDIGTRDNRTRNVANRAGNGPRVLRLRHEREAEHQQ